MRSMMLAIGALLSGWATFAAAAEGPSADRLPFARFKRLDRVADMALDRGELAAPGGRAALFAILDANGDGVLTAADGAPADRVARRALGAAGGPSDRPRRLGGREFAAMPLQEILAALDRDGDGRLGLAELRPSLAGNRPLAPPAPPPAPAAIEPPARPAPCWFLDGQGRWIELPPLSPACAPR